MKALYISTYHYTHELIHAFCRVHLWYHRRQHPLFLKTPGIFLVGCLLWRLLSFGRAGERISFEDGLMLALIALFAFFMVWMGFIHPRVFERTLQQNLNSMADDPITILFYEDHIHAESTMMRADYTYEQVSSGYVTMNCIFLYANQEQALMIPFESIPPQDRSGFQKLISRKLSGKLSKKAHIA